MNRTVYIILFIFLFLTTIAGFAGSTNYINTSNYQEERVIVSRFNKTTEGKVYYEVKGKPFLFVGTEIRIDAFKNCEGQTIEDLEKYFKASKDLGVTTVLIPIEWRYLEPVKDEYDFTIVAKLLEYAMKYNLKMEFLWFSTNMCGDSHSFHIPDYIWNDEVTYPKYITTHKGWWWSYYGWMGLLWLSNPALLERETKVVRRLMDFVYEWDNNNGATQVVIGVQLYSEPDAFPRWRLALQNIKLPDGSRNITEEEAWDDVFTSLNIVGKAFKESKYSVVTRTNLIQLQVPNNNWEYFAVEIFNLEGVDAVGNDSYTTDLKLTKKSLLDLAGREYNYSNWPHIAENKGSYSNTPSLILQTFALGGGYNIYDISTPKHFIDNPGNDPYFAAGIDHGILTTYNYLNPNPEIDLQDKPHTQETRVLLQGLKDASYPIIMTKVCEIAAFNIIDDLPQTNFQQIINTNLVSFNFKTSQAAIGFGMAYDGYVILFSTKDSEIKLRNIIFSSPESGSYNCDGIFTHTGTPQFKGNKINLEGGKVYRVKIDSVMPVICEVYKVLNFEDEEETLEIIDHLHTHDWQTNPAYSRNLYAINPDQTGMNQTKRCAMFSGYHSGNEWWYGLDIVLKEPVFLSDNMKYVHALLMTNNINADTNRGLLLLDSNGKELINTWHYITDYWVDYVFPIPEGTVEIGEFRFMFNHQATGTITYLDEIVIGNCPNPRTSITTGIGIIKGSNEEIFNVYSYDKSINVISSSENSNIQVYTILGKCIFIKKISGNRVTIPVKEKGIYIVRCNEFVKKILVN